MVKKNCASCVFFEQRSRFCRFNPPSVVVVYEENQTYGNNDTEKVQYKFKSMYPTVVYPQLDWCSQYKFAENNLITE